MGMEIKDARIVTAFLKKKGDLYEFLFDIDLYDGRRYVAPYLLITHEELCKFFDVVGVRSGVPVRNTPIRVLVDDKGEVLLFGNSMDNKWVDLKRFEIIRIKEETVVPNTEDNEKDRTQKKMKDLNKVIERPYRMTEIRKRFDKLDLVEIDTYLDQGEYFLSKESDEDCRQYIFNTIAREIAEIAYIEPPEYTPEKAKHFRDTMNKHLLLALQYNEY